VALSYAAISEQLSASLRERVEPRPAATVHGGCINECFKWKRSGGALFVKIAEAQRRSMLEAEAAGLEELARAEAVRVPRVLALGTAGEHAYLALEWIDLSGSSSGSAQTLLGERLARQHRKSAERFGWDRDNTIGNTPQINAWSHSWPAFFRDSRLRFQLQLAERHGFGGRLQERGTLLLEHVAEFFADHQPAPSLLHGDLWGGNAASDEHGTPVIFDPAVYYGDREADLAMTRLFGGFSAAFYSAYEAAWPLPPSARSRVELYNLYHVLNHLNLFGSGYLRQAESTIDKLLAMRR
jgi:protein-ribulosamine 3-kinase